MTGKRFGSEFVYALIAYLLAFLLLGIVLTPFLVAIVSSFKAPGDFYAQSYTWLPTEWRWQNYVDAWRWAQFGKFMQNSLICAAAVTVCSTLISSMAAFGFARIHFKGRNVIFYIFLLTQGVPFSVLFIPTYILMNRLGLVNTLAGLILPLISFPMGTFLMRQNMMTIPIDFEYAAKIDGCNRFKMFWFVFLPMVSNTVVALAIFTFMGSWNNYIWPLVIVNKREIYTLPLGLALYSNNNAVGSRLEWNAVLAAAIMSVLPILLVYSFASSRFMEGITLGGIKG